MFFFSKPDIDQELLKSQSIVIKNDKKGESDILRNRGYGNKIRDCITYIYNDPETREKKKKLLYNSIDCFYNGMEINGRDSRFLGRRINNRYEWMTFGEAEEAYKNLGSAMINMYGYKIKNGFDNTLGIYMVNCPEWNIADYACLFYNIISTPLYNSFDLKSLKFIIDNTNVSLVITHMEHINNLFEISAQTKTLKHIIVCNYGLTTIPVDKLEKAKECGLTLRTLDEVLEFGKQNPVEPSPIATEDVFTICYTSGTTGTPKGVILKNGSICAGYYENSGFNITKGHIHYSYLPLAHVLERVTSHAFLSYGAIIGFFSSSANNIISDIGILKPNDMPSVPRVLCKIYDNIINSVNNSGLIKRFIFNFAVERKRKLLRKGIITRKSIWDKIVFDKIQNVVGGEMRFIICGSAPIDFNIIEFMRIVLGCQVYEGYGQTETCTVSNIQIYGDYQYPYGSNIGPPACSCEMKLIDVPEMDYYTNDEPNPRGEICTRGYNGFIGYHNNPEATAETLDEDGWIHSGDIGEFLPNGTVKIIDRRKNIFKLAQGEYIAPEKIEAVINNSRFISQSYIDGNPLSSKLVGIIVPDVENVVPEIKSENDNTEWTLEKVCKSESARLLILQDIENISRNFGLNGYEIPKEIALISEPFSIENKLLTPTFKNKRIQIGRHYSEIINKLYEKVNN
ncbi:long-chain-fatty-acid--CoA ligase 1 [Anaeromyces robustus]|uniref:Long-chain-fatty-acid--CoA ligase 1 n=1 Tax=Anaeromyces robustus TaxID=1754192 RepID=A0A1Y1XIH5_9FUNG|nr:long-chain-fatty-acid--CoA ligase 1 [Anaeromyces robustus]|eukprot:ORX85557.1 long-chain-fatty-acid--CoA ligase 1 [Anaeromyces robustus]